MNIQQVLLKYWGYGTFRPLQEDIIQSVIDGKDTLVLLPTGGGKSICFQVPALYMPGICVVVTPLIALMLDQVQGLRSRGIMAYAIHSGLTKKEIDIILDNCIYGDVKFLYLSPERLDTELAIARLQKMKVNLLVVDEAHCISQWGYDFRPAYLKIAHSRTYLPNTPVLALTATATQKVILDIQEKLQFREPLVIRGSFERRNLIYAVVYEEDKRSRMFTYISLVKGCSIVYAPTRGETKQLAHYLISKGISADYYHAGLSGEDRAKKQQAWTQGRTQVMVSTNAFGMGIDKSNVRLVIHYSPSESLEAYFQEAGRAGRDGLKAFAVLLYDNADIDHLNGQTALAYPEIKEIKKTYHALGNYCGVAIGTGNGRTVDFDIADFTKQYHLAPYITHNILAILEKTGYIALSGALHLPTRIQFRQSHTDVYRFQVEHKRFDAVIKLLLRSYPGLFDDYVKINEHILAQRLQTTPDIISTLLHQLEQLEIIYYIPAKDKPQITYLTERLEEQSVYISYTDYMTLKENYQRRIEAMITYITSDNKCRSQKLLAYFEEENSYRCGFCDVCKKRNSLALSHFEFDSVINEIKPILQQEPCTLEQLMVKTMHIPEQRVFKVLQWLLDNGKVMVSDHGLYTWVV